MTDVVGWATKKTSDGLISGEINQNWLFCIPIQVGPATEYARGARHWFAFIILTQVGQAVAQLILSGALLTSVMMAVTALIGLYAWYQDMNITYICLWGAASLFQGLMTCISSLLPAITGVLSFDVWSLVLLISVPGSSICLASLQRLRGGSREESLCLRSFRKVCSQVRPAGESAHIGQCFGQSCGPPLHIRGRPHLSRRRLWLNSGGLYESIIWPPRS